VSAESSVSWFIVIALFVFFATMAVSFARIARAIMQDYNHRFRAIEVQLERQATSVLDPLLSRPDEEPPRKSH
jgi:hypothetical protein